MDRTEKLTILIVDDQVEVLEIYEAVLGAQLGHRVECVSMPAEALRHARNHLFDVAIVDAKITYKGAPLGGLNLADDLSVILGIGSIILMSQYNVREEVRHFNPAYTFLPKPHDGGNLLGWVRKELLAKVHGMVKEQYAFVAMPYGDPESDDYYHSRLVPWMKEAGFDIRRMDEIPTTGAISEKMLQKIKDAHFVVLYFSKKNPNVFFEAGYACACDKRMILFASDIGNLPFDIRAHRAFQISEPDKDAAHDHFLRFMRGLRGLPV